MVKYSFTKHLPTLLEVTSQLKRLQEHIAADAVISTHVKDILHGVGSLLDGGMVEALRGRFLKGLAELVKTSEACLEGLPKFLALIVQ